jgi:hypothetical protein
MTIGLSAHVLSVERRGCAMEAALLRSALEWPREDRAVFRLDLAKKLVPVTETLALFIAVTNAVDEPEDDFRL